MRLLNKPWFLFVLLIPFFRPGLVPHLPGTSVMGFSVSLNSILLAWQIASTAVVVVLFYFYGKINKMLIAVIAYSLAFLFSTLYNSGDFMGYVTSTSTVIGICLLMSLAATINPKDLLKVMYGYLGLLAVSNLFTVLIFPDGIVHGRASVYVWRQYLLGTRNGMTTILVFALLVCAVYPFITKKRLSIWTIVVFVCVGITQLTLWSATGVAACFALIILILLVSRGIVQPLNFAILFPVNVGMFLFMVVFRMQAAFAFLIQDVFGRTLTFTGRTYIWDYSIRLIAQSPLIGYGHTQEHLARYRIFLMADSHNAFLEILLRGGIFALIPFIAIIILAGMTLMRHKSHPISALFSVGMFVILIASLFNAYFNSVYLFSIFVLSFHVDKIIAAQQEEVQVDLSAEPLIKSKYIKTRTRVRYT